jgi:hypothetical protein
MKVIPEVCHVHTKLDIYVLIFIFINIIHLFNKCCNLSNFMFVKSIKLQHPSKANTNKKGVHQT